PNASRPGHDAVPDLPVQPPGAHMVGARLVYRPSRLPGRAHPPPAAGNAPAGGVGPMSTLQPGPAARPARRRFTRPVPVSVNGVTIASADIARETQHHQSADPDEAWMLASRALAIREL